MTSKNDPEVPRFLRVADDRANDAEVLFAGGRTTAALYLGGYVAECVLKAMLLANTPRSRRVKMVESFRGMSAHDLERLRRLIVRQGIVLPDDVAEAIAWSASWSTDLRYRAGQVPRRGVRTSLDAAASIRRWVLGRI